MNKISGWTGEDLVWYRLVNIKGIGIKSCLKLLDHFRDICSLWRAEEKDLAGILNKKQISSLLDARETFDPGSSANRLVESGTRFIHMNHKDYPDKLRHIYLPPPGLYVRGRLPSADSPCLAMVGSRRATNYGRGFAKDYARILSECGVQIISGLAAGVDTESHIGALQAGGYTAAVLGGGIDSIYPRENFRLYREMYARGGVISEYNIGVPNNSGLFPMRNRIISGLSDGIFVLEAAEKSGSLITASQGLEQGKDIFALPGRVTDEMSKGCNELIAQGAIPVNNPEDILDVLFAFKNYKRDAIKEDRDEDGTGGQNESGHRSGKGKQNESGHRSGTGKEDDLFGLSNRMKGQDEETILVFSKIDLVAAISFEALAAECGIDRKHLEYILYKMEINGLIFQPVQGLYRRTVG